MGTKYAKEFVLPVGIGVWLANLVLLPIGLVLVIPGLQRLGPAGSGLLAAAAPAAGPAQPAPANEAGEGEE